MADKPINEVVEVDAVLDALSSPTSSDVYEAVEPYSHAAVSAVAAKRALAGGGGGSSAVLEHSTTLSSADLLDLHNTAVELLPAPGGRFYYDVQHIVWHYRYGGIPYSGTWDDVMIGFYPAGVPFPDYDPLSNTLTTFSPWGESSQGFNVLAQTEDVYQMAALPHASSAVGWLASNIENLPLSVGIQNISTAPDPVVPWTDGNGSLTIRTFYSLINGAPA